MADTRIDPKTREHYAELGRRSAARRWPGTTFEERQAATANATAARLEKAARTAAYIAELEQRVAELELQLSHATAA